MNLPAARSRWRAGLVLAAGLLAGPACGAVEGFRYSRELKVPTAGWVRVPLDLAAVQHMAPGGADLHVFSPQGAEVPVFALPDPATSPSLTITTRDSACQPGPLGGTACLLALSAPGQSVRRLGVEIAGPGARIGYRLYLPREGRWHLQEEGIWQREGERTRHVLAPPRRVPDAVLRLELSGNPGSPPQLASYDVELTAPALLFEAREPGGYTLAYGGVREEGRRPRRPEPAGLVVAELGLEEEQAPPPLPGAAAIPGVRLDERRLGGSWPVVAPAIKAGTLVRLELPDAIYGPARPDLGNLRLVRGERQIPFFRWSPAVPVLASRREALRPEESARQDQESEVEIRLPDSGLPLTSLDLAVPAAPVRRVVGVRYPDPLGEERDRPPVVRDVWECRPQPPLPCRESLELPADAPSEVSVRFHDGDNPPLTGLEAMLWRRQDVLLFVWPGGEEPVRLVVGPERLESPSYDLQALGEALLRYPWQPVELDLQGNVPAAEPWWSRWVRPMMLLLATVALLLLLRRILMGEGSR